MPEILDFSGKYFIKDPSLPESLRDRIFSREMGARVSRGFPQIQSQKPSSSNDTAYADMEAFVYHFFDDVPDTTIKYATDALLAIMRDINLSYDTRKLEVEGVLDHSLSSSEFDNLNSIAQRVPAEDVLMDDLDEDDLIDIDDVEHTVVRKSTPENSAFVALNDPIRLRNKTIVRPQDIDAHWLHTLLESTEVSDVEILSLIGEEPNSDYENVCSRLEKLLGLENFETAQLIARNSKIIYWYTKLAQAPNGVVREEILDEINARGLSIEEVVQQENMDQNLPRELDLRIVGVPMGGVQYMSAPGFSVQLPEGSTRYNTRDYEQYNVPAASTVDQSIVEWPLVKIANLPEYVQTAFSGVPSLNIVQSKVCDSIINSDNNILLCAPTGAGKTNVALLAITKCLHEGFRAVYIAPLKALVQEQVVTLQSKLGAHYVVSELSGDQALSREQLSTVDVIVATPEKWDIVSRKPANTELLRSIGLVVIDEIHLLHDEFRGSVIENIVIRHKRTQYPPRLLGLSATMPNYRDVGEFLQVPPSGIHFFDAKFRPVPLEQKYIGVTPKSPLKQLKAVNDACVEMVMEIAVEQCKQVLIFVHSRKDTETTRDLLSQDLLEGKVGIHHAGLSRNERDQNESGFRDGELKVLVTTATLAWGINLPVAAVIIKGTQYYDASKEGWSQLSPQDVLQMLGRAGRPGFDIEGLGVIITSHKHLNYFASVANLAMPIQSYLIKRVFDSLNAEVAAKTILSIDDAIDWLKESFWFVRSQADPSMYGDDYSVSDIAHSALMRLQASGAIEYDYPKLRSTFLGELAASFYISPSTVALFSGQLKPWLADVDIIRIFSRSAEFESLPLRRSEMHEIRDLSALVPIPVRDPLESKYAKVSILLQAYIGRLRLSGLALSSDIVYVAQSASRLFRAIFELATAVKWGRVAKRALDLFLMVDNRQWISGQTPLRQFKGCPNEIVRRAESSQIPWQRYFDLEESDFGEFLGISNQKIISQAYCLVQKFPRFEIKSTAQPISSRWLWIDIAINLQFEIDPEFHNLAEQFWLFIETSRGRILSSTRVNLRQLSSSSYIRLIPVEAESTNGTTCDYPYLFVKLESERWLYCEATCPVNLRRVTLPANDAVVSELPDEPELITSTIENTITSFDSNLPVLARSLAPLLSTKGRSLYLGMPPGTTFDACLKLAVETAQSGGENVLVITVDVARTRTLLCDLDVHVISTVEAEASSCVASKLEQLVNSTDCVICTDLHRIGSSKGYRQEAMITRLRMVGGEYLRFVGMGYPVTSAHSIASWLGAARSDAYNFGLSAVDNTPSIKLLQCNEFVLNNLWEVMSLINPTLSTIVVTYNGRQVPLLKNELVFKGYENVTVLQADELLAGSMNAQNIVVLLNDANPPPSDLLSLVSRASQEVVIYTTYTEFYASCIDSLIPLESNLHLSLDDVFAHEIAQGKIKQPQDAVNWLASTFLYKRLRQNASFYGSFDLQDWISEAVESSFERLAKCAAVKIIDYETLEIEPLPLCHVAAYRGVQLTDLLDSVSPVTVDNRLFWRTNHSECEQYLRLLDARIDLAVSNNRLLSLFTAADQRQALVQSVPLGASPLRQIPHVNTADAVQRCEDAGIKSVQDFVAIEDDDLRCKILEFDNDDERMAEVAEFINHFPIVDISSVEKISDGKLRITIERDMEEDEEQEVHAAVGYPSTSNENWLLVVADNDRQVIAFQRLEIRDPVTVLDIDIFHNECSSSPSPNGGSSDADESPTKQITTWLICGTYIDADKEFALR